MKWKFGERARGWLGVAVLCAAALGVRCPRLGERPMHADEAVHAVVLGQMLETGVYRYNPQDSHGPTLYYLSALCLRMSGVRRLAEMEAWHLRMVSVLVGTAAVAALALWRRELGTGAVLAAGLLSVLAAPLVYYQRYFIHESLYVLLTLLLLRVAWSWSRARESIGLGVATGAVTALLFATKETAPLVLLALGLAAVGLHLTRNRETPGRPASWRVALRSARWAAVSFAVVFALFYTSFGTNGGGLADFAAAQLRFAHRAAGEGHEKPWWTYVSWLLRPNFYVVPWSGWVIGGLAALGTVRGWTRPTVRFLFFFGLALGVLYSLVPYKTPWLEINFLAPATLLAGVGVSAALRSAHGHRLIFVSAAVLAMLGMGRETWQTCFAHAADPRNPLAYSPTVGDVELLAARVGQLRRADAGSPTKIIQVISTDYWPLPWYLRRLGPVGYWNDVPPAITGDIVIASPDRLPSLQAKLGPGCKVEYFGLRPEVLAIVLSKPERSHD